MRGGKELVFAILLLTIVFQVNQGTANMFNSMKEHFEEKLQLNAFSSFKTEVLNHLKDIKYQLEAGGKPCGVPNVTSKPPLLPNFPIPGFNGNPTSSGGESGGGGSGGGIIDVNPPCRKDDGSE